MKKRIVVIGGGTGTYTVLRGLKKYPELDISAIVTMADDGGSNRVLRDEFGLLPTSGVRQCMVALSENEGLLRQLFSYRYYQGVGIAGMTFGNLFMAAVADVMHDQRQAIKETAKFLGVTEKILPVSYDRVSLLATYEDGTEVLGEHLIDLGKGEVGRKRIVSLRTVPRTKIDREARRAIEEADLIVLGPGDLYTNTIANLVVDGVAEAITKSKAKLVFAMNLMTKMGESYAYKASMFLEDLGKYLPVERVDCVVVNSDLSIQRNMREKYTKEGAEMVRDDLEQTKDSRFQIPVRMKIVREKLLWRGKVKKERGDELIRSMVRHDPDRLAKVIMGLL
ncbi:MAG: gluconeogenesis factor YvcK family protein [bacterium]